MVTLANSGVGRILLHLRAMLGDRCVRFHIAGIIRELPWIEAAMTLLTRTRTRLIGALVLYLAKPIKQHSPGTTADARSFATILDPGDVLLSAGNTRVAALVKRMTRSTWSHVSMYVGPLEDGSDPRCVVEADVAAGVRSIRLSELEALHVRVLRPIGMNDMDRRRLADWVVSRIGGEYDLAHAWVLGRNLMRRRLPTRLQSLPYTMAKSATRFICCSLLAHAFALVGYPILPVQMRDSPTGTTDHGNLTPADFEGAPVFTVVWPIKLI
jgi:Permuted papain-like amidase enzyme, YaeF/YiiX, C92 family